MRVCNRVFNLYRWLPIWIASALLFLSIWTLPIRALPPKPVLLKSISSTFDSNPNSFEGTNGILYFSADDGEHGEELWQTNGTEAGTVIVKDIRPGDIGSNPGGLKEVNGVIFFKADDGSAGTELWKSDGTITGTVMVKDIRPGDDSSFPSKFQNIGGMLYFQATDGTHGVELWESDGTVTGTVMVKDINPSSSSSPNLLANLNGTLFFIADDGTNGLELWRSDGSENGTVLVKDIQPGPTSSAPNRLVVMNDLLFFVADDGTNGMEIWKSDGSENGTVLIKDIQPGPTGSDVGKLTASNQQLFFIANDGTHGLELWKSDGTERGTNLVKDIFLPSSLGDSSAPSELTDVDGVLFFSANDGSRGRELWSSDGTESATMLVRDIMTGPASSRPNQLTTAEGALFFRAETNEAGVELWKSNGTEVSTVMVGDIYPETNSSDPLYMTSLHDSLFFCADDGTNGRQLWMLGLQNEPPTANADTPVSGDEGNPIKLHVDPFDADDNVLSYSWTAGSSFCEFSDPTGFSPSLTCVDNGIYTATEIVSDWWNASTIVSVTVTVANVAPVIESSAVIVTAPLSILLHTSFTDLGSNDTHTANVNWGDGKLEPVTVDQMTKSLSASHTYLSSGEYELAVSIMDNDDGAAVGTITVSLPNQMNKVLLPFLHR